ncbi:septum formation initiator family protein [Tetragenococcus koreensis]|uniref:Septum formation initiation protein n=1 Tax=Tetragenococcus koreensis TaxID=290335 RepID=A0AAN4ZTT4_9ENTE|nr:septum formation initiator family protein [Tetragenococcus koreensis]AYW45996.1 septum formation initiator [Tetragenococcus koreensis]MCF1584657.1 septum formation initiator family protein [Tetragenococcus koreensis]MCF1614313.1 septum formation initiator family protein [Tetragenococcus koreensis]MCF1616460.1 septum formation initiator family protein [Tetragenococcus koreensis]MCF1619631.1 septum formation initiator family protein [Tetragenococcus koreensis]
MDNQEKSNVKVLDNEYAKKQYAKYAKEQRQIIFRRRRLLAIFVVAAIVFLSVGISLFNDYLRLQKLENYREETVAEQKDVTKQTENLKKDVSLLKDEDYVAKIARSRFLYSDDDEIVFPLPGNESDEEINESD